MSEFDFLQRYRDSFSKSDLGRLHSQLPLHEMASSIRTKMNKKPCGNQPTFPLEGEIALMFLKSYFSVSDDRLTELLNGSIHMQIFCGVLLDPSESLKNGRIVSAIRNRLAQYLDIKDLQKVLYNKWQPLLSDKDLCLTDATCYESHLRFPTDVKLLWECCEWLHSLMAKTCRSLKIRQPRNKYNDVDKARLAYAKQRKHKYSSTRKLLRRLLSLLSKLIEQWNAIYAHHKSEVGLNAEQLRRMNSLCEVYAQQRDHFAGKDVKGRIVSIDRPYIRPIKRGKENKTTEFGAKVNNIQIGGVAFIEHHSFEAFNEGVRLKHCIEYQEELTGEKVRRVGADTIYATNENRKYCSENGILTCFARKGPKPKDESEETKSSRKIIGCLRATMMEGSFGNQKQHYGLGRIAARNRESETLLLFFGIHTANAALLADRQYAEEIQKQQSQKNVG